MNAHGPDPARLAPVSHAIFQVARLHKAIAGRLLREAGLHPGQELVLMALWADGPQRMVDLVTTIGSDAPSMTRSVARLERAGWVSRTPSETDGRVMIIEATPASRALATKVERAWAELERRTAGPLTDRQRRDVLRSLGLLEDTLLATEA